MGNKIVTEADRKFTPPMPVLPGVTLPTHGRGQRVSLERGVSTRNKKNPGKRSKKAVDLQGRSLLIDIKKMPSSEGFFAAVRFKFMFFEILLILN